MAISGYSGSAVTKGNVDSFIPEVWSQEVKRELDNNLIFKELVKHHSFGSGEKKGDTLHIPTVYRFAVNDKGANSPVTLQTQTTGEFTMTIDKFKESSFLIEDVAELFAKASVRREFTRETGYAISRDLDNYLLALRADIQGIGTNVIYSTNNGTAGGTFEAFDEAAFLAACQLLDEANVPREGRYLVVSPGQYTDLLTIDRFSSADYVNEKPVSNGIIGSLYGVPVKMTTQIGVNSLTGYVNGAGGVGQPTPGVTGSPYYPTQPYGSAASLPYDGDGTHTAPGGIVTAVLAHKDWAYLAIPRDVKVESSRENLYQADAVVTTLLYGAKTYRPDHAVLIHTTA
jgi:hypothetical protein